METVVLKVDTAKPEPDMIRQAVEVIRGGGLVAFPTETVYGLGANTLNAAAVARIFEAKGRPATNPVIVHVSDASEVLNVAANWPETAARLARAFWPGPLTLVLPKSNAVPPIVTAGGPTVAVRCPNHTIAQTLIREARVSIAAPSANRSTELSPTRAEHVLKSLNGRIDLLLDGGPCSGGIESTVVDVTGKIPRVLRPGLISVPMLEAVCGRVDFGAKGEGVSRSPGQMVKHYSPRTPVVLVENAEEAERLQSEWRANGVRAIVLGFSLPLATEPSYWTMLYEPEQYAADLYAVLHEIDREGWDRIVIEMPPDTLEWAAIRDRLTRAAAG